LTGMATNVPITEPEDIYLIDLSGSPSSFCVIACSTIGADITPPGIPATATGIETVSFLTTIADMKNARIIYGENPNSANAIVTGASTAVSSVPGAITIKA